MSELIRIEGVSKRYRLGVINRGMLYKDIQSWWARKTGREDPHTVVGVEVNGNRKFEENGEFWALQDINLSIEQGDTVGIIGRNGAGKSTLLKILSRTTLPTKGKIYTRGRIASLLEVGTGFHPELTGRENVYLNGAILGMTRKEVASKFEEIVAFSEIENFIDTPVKRYSSGMYVRLAFAVAAHLEPDILIVDEVLAVGDSAFQSKCIGRIGDVNKEGRTVIVVSHNMAMLSSLCKRGVVLSKGKIANPITSINESINFYLSQVADLSKIDISDRSDRQGEGKLKINNIQILDKNLKNQDTVMSGQEVIFQISYSLEKGKVFDRIEFALGIYNSKMGFVGMLSNEIAGTKFDSVSESGFVRCLIKKLPLTQGNYTLNVAIRQAGVMQDWVQEALVFSVVSGDFFKTGRTVPDSHGGILIEQSWEKYR
jgi:lipopolysaccharide transport system ATP-binding protein